MLHAIWVYSIYNNFCCMECSFGFLASSSLSLAPPNTLYFLYCDTLGRYSSQLAYKANRMAQLPPKVPSLTPSWPDFAHQRVLPSADSAAAAVSQNPSWVDEFLDFSAARRGSHRRSISDSITFIETPLDDECRRRPYAHHGGMRAAANEFDRLDDEQLMSMFAEDEIAVAPTISSSNTSSPSDHNSINDEKPPPFDLQQQPKTEPEEVQSSETAQVANKAAPTENNSSDKIIIDPKRVKRILANRQSAQRSRVRKLQYISELERSVTSLQAEVSVLSPRVAFLDHQRLILNVDNSALKQRIAALAQDKIFKDAHQDALRREIERLRKVYHDQNLKKIETAVPPSADTKTAIENSQLLES